MAGFKVIKLMAKGKGMSIHLAFSPKEYDESNLLFNSHVALIQSVTCVNTTDKLKHQPFRSNGPNQPPQTRANRNIDAPGKGRKCPVFGMRSHPESSFRSYDKITSARSITETGGLGFIGRESRDAFLKDEPSRGAWKSGISFDHTFEVVAMCISKNKEVNGTILGVCTWGYSVDGAGKVDIKKVKTRYRPTQQWIQSAKLWNNGVGAEIPLDHSSGIVRTEGFYGGSSSRGRKSVMH